MKRGLLIKMTSHEPHIFSDHRQLDCLFNNLFKLTLKKTSKLRISGPLWVESTRDWRIPLTEDQYCGKHFYGVTMKPVWLSWQPDRFFGPMSPSAVVCTDVIPWNLAMKARTRPQLTAQRTHDAITTSLWRQNDVATSFWRHNNVVIASCVRWEMT